MDERADDHAWDAVGHNLPPVHLARDLLLGQLAAPLTNEVGAFLAEHERQHQGTGAFRIVDRQAVQFGDGLREQRRCLEERGRLHRRERQRGDRPYGRDDGRGAYRRTARGDGGQVAAADEVRDFVGRGIRMPAPDAPQVRQHDRSLHSEKAVDAPIDAGRNGDTASRARAGDTDERLDLLRASHVFESRDGAHSARRIDERGTVAAP